MQEFLLGNGIAIGVPSTTRDVANPSNGRGIRVRGVLSGRGVGVVVGSGVVRRWHGVRERNGVRETRRTRIERGGGKEVGSNIGKEVGKERVKGSKRRGMRREMGRGPRIKINEFVVTMNSNAVVIFQRVADIQVNVVNGAPRFFRQVPKGCGDVERLTGRAVAIAAPE